jgi:hypothetical protein
VLAELLGGTICEECSPDRADEEDITARAVPTLCTSKASKLPADWSRPWSHGNVTVGLATIRKPCVARSRSNSATREAMKTWRLRPSTPPQTQTAPTTAESMTKRWQSVGLLRQACNPKHVLIGGTLKGTTGVTCVAQKTHAKTQTQTHATVDGKPRRACAPGEPPRTPPTSGAPARKPPLQNPEAPMPR